MVGITHFTPLTTHHTLLLLTTHTTISNTPPQAVEQISHKLSLLHDNSNRDLNNGLVNISASCAPVDTKRVLSRPSELSRE